MALTGLSPSSTARATSRAASRSFLETSPLRSVWITRSCCSPLTRRAELCRVLHAQVVADVVRLGGAVEHDEQDRLLAQRRELVPVLSPALDARGEVRPVLDAGDVGGLLLDAGRDSLHRALDDVVDDRLLERIVVDRPGEEPALLRSAVSPRRRAVRAGPRAMSSWRRRITWFHSLSSSWV